MFIDPRRVSASCMDHAKERIYANKIPRINGRATRRGIALQLFGIKRSDSAFGETRARRSAIQFGVVDINALIVVSSRSERSSVRCARAARQAGAGLYRRRIEQAIVRYVVIKPGRLRRAT